MKRLTLAALLLSAATLTAQNSPRPRINPQLHLTSAPYTQLYVFGDSYSDSGSGYLDTNGPTAVAYLAKQLDIPFTFYGDPASHGKGLNFAISGAGSGPLVHS